MQHIARNIVKGTVKALSKLRPVPHKISDVVFREGKIDVTIDIGHRRTMDASMSPIVVAREGLKVGDPVELEIMRSAILVRKVPTARAKTTRTGLRTQRATNRARGEEDGHDTMSHTTTPTHRRSTHPGEVTPQHGALEAHDVLPPLRDAEDTRLSLIACFVDALLPIHMASKAAGIADPVIVISDASGGALAREFLGKASISFVLMSAADVCRIPGVIFTERVDQQLKAITPDSQLILCLAAGGVTSGYLVFDVANERFGLAPNATAERGDHVIPLEASGSHPIPHHRRAPKGSR